MALGNWALPSKIQWYSPDEVWSKQTTNTFVVSDDMGDFPTVRWTSQYYTFQVQWRYRARYNPMAAATKEATDKYNAWDDWTEWEGSDLQGASVTQRNDAGWSYIPDETFQVPTEYTKYDKWEYEFRVRVYNVPDVSFSEWAYETLEIIYKPKSFALHAVPIWEGKAEYGAFLFIDETDWGRPITCNLTDYSSNVPLVDADPDMRPCWVGSGEGKAYVYEYGVSNWNNRDVSPKCEINSLHFDGTAAPFEEIWFGANTSFNFAGSKSFTLYELTGSYFVKVKPDKYSSSVHEITATLNGEQLRVLGRSNNQPNLYSNVLACASWNDSEGNAYAADIEMTHSGNYWVGDIENAPYDMPINLRIVAVGTGSAAGMWRDADITAEIPSNGRHTWTNDSGTVSIVLHTGDSTVSFDEDMAVETNKALGLRRPNSTYETGGEREISFDGVILTDWQTEYQDTTHAQFLKVMRNEGGTWFRTPNGGRYRVAIKSFSFSQHAHYEEVSVKMEEVNE